MDEQQIFPIMINEETSGLHSINMYLVKMNQKLLLIDAGYHHPKYEKAFDSALQQFGFSLNDLTAILLTHHHIDHVGLVNYITKQHSLPVYVHPIAFPRLKRDLDFLQTRIDFFEKLYREMDCNEAGQRQIKYLQKAIMDNAKQKIDVDLQTIPTQYEDFEVVTFPGHAPDQVGFYLREQQILFGGDLLIEHISSNALVEPDQQGNRLLTLIEHKHSLEKCLKLPLSRVYAGHGQVIDSPQELIQKRIEQINQKAERILKLIRQGFQTGNAIALEMYAHRYQSQFPLVMSEVIGHLDYLEYNGLIEKRLHPQTQIAIYIACSKS
ncbi:MBL fold metallo-hydrolase [Alkalihalobacillus pseudalcaliphilus]|uniref:MBL fold metallo-hydrolase n=1 Tax=Alkalihalobacillus pseudalcaliphilus TaxID=79884 RepID=UPI00064D9193|nr:MBL fold metallo-hydrolase [Alkalihalobacillus pseudalcaliphilus]KMK75730.1 hypothetical protein AB990_10655 [Alkalihalobacillus pseudalcaliphilus]